ncbi:MAG TPA: hypothetical protein VNS79_10200 [Sphingobium sp.]|nr:hypothetical protein [Sphingobium sp.]
MRDAILALGCVILAAFAVGPAALAQAKPERARAETASSQIDTPQKARKLCRRDKLTGTRVAKVRCATQAEWEAFDAASAAEAVRFQDKVMQQSKIDSRD